MTDPRKESPDTASGAETNQIPADQAGRSSFTVLLRPGKTRCGLTVNRFWGLIGGFLLLVCHCEERIE